MLESHGRPIPRGGQYRIRALLIVTAVIALGSYLYTALNRKPKFISTAFWTNMPPPSEAEVQSELDKCIDQWITIDGAAAEENGKAAVWISDEIVLVASDRTDWPNRPSHRSHVMVTGYLTKKDGKLTLDRTTFNWIDQ